MREAQRHRLTTEFRLRPPDGGLRPNRPSGWRGLATEGLPRRERGLELMWVGPVRNSRTLFEIGSSRLGTERAGELLFDCRAADGRWAAIYAGPDGAV
jgi:hypothetical protein